MRLRYWFLIVLFGLATAVQAQVPTPADILDAQTMAVDMYIKFDRIDGEVQTRGYEKWIELLAYTHTLTAEPNTGRTGGQVIHEPVQVAQRLNVASVRLIEALNRGEVNPKVEVAFVRTGQERFEFLHVTFEDVVLIEHTLQHAVGDDVPVEQYAFVYRKITWTYTPQKADGTPGTPVTYSYDVQTGTSLTAALTAFSAASDGDDVVFAWTTSGESGIYGFELQQWQEGDFRRTAYLPGAGWSSKNLEYELRVRGLERGLHAFRLAVLGVDGAVAYSDEVEVAVGVPEGVEMAVAPYPNPFAEALRVAVAVARPREARVSVFDLLGREVALVFDGLLEPGGERRFDVPTAALASGVYVVRVASEGEVVTRLVTRAD